MDIKKRAIVYVRVSTVDQVEGASLDNQEERCQEWAFRNGVLIQRTFREEGVSAKTTNRPELRNMRKYIEEHGKKIDYLVVYEMDRLARNMEDFMEIMKELRKYKIELKDPSSTLEGSRADKMLRYMKAITAEMDNEMKSERVIDNMKRHGSEGYRMGKAPYGLLNSRDTLGNSILKPAPVIAPKLAHVLNEFSKGTYTIKELINLANETGLTSPGGKPMNHAFMGKTLRRPVYAGLEQSEHTDGQLVEANQFEGIISRDTFWRNQRLLERRRGSRVESYSINNPEFPLRRFLVCATCKRPIRGSASTGGSGKKYPKYHCTHCPKAAVDAAVLNEQFQHLLTHVTPSAVSLRLMKTMIIRVWNDELKILHQERLKRQKRIDALGEHKLKATSKVVTDEITKQEKISIHMAADKEIAELRDSVSKLDMQMGTKQDAIDYVLSYMENAKQLWIDATPDMKVTYQTMIFPDGIEYDFYENKFGTLKMSALYALANIRRDPSTNDASLLVGEERIELSLCCQNGILSPARLPIPPLALVVGQFITRCARLHLSLHSGKPSTQA